MRESVHLKENVGGADKIERYSWIARDTPGEMLWIPKENLLVDHLYQRQPVVTKVRRIASKWTWGACGVLLVAKRSNNKLYIYDGQYRWNAAMLRSDIEKMPCIIFPSLGSEMEAIAFYIANTDRKSVAATDKFRALLHGKDSDAVFIDGYIQKWNLTYNDDESANAIRCVNALQIIAKDRVNFAKVFDFTANLCKDICQITSTLIKGLSYINTHCGAGLADTKLAKRLIDIGPKELTLAASRQRAMQGAGGERVFALGIIERVNKNLQYKFIVM
jgi:hypothetical protein